MLLAVWCCDLPFFASERCEELACDVLQSVVELPFVEPSLSDAEGAEEVSEGLDGTLLGHGATSPPVAATPPGL